MATPVPMRALAICDKTSEFLKTPGAPKHFDNLDFIIGCGDLPYYYLEAVQENFALPMFYVRGNHDKAIEYTQKGQKTGPIAGVDLHRRFENFNGLLIVGFEGSMRYREGPFMYSQAEMWMNVFSMLPRLLLNRVIHGRFLDVLVTHAPSWDIHDKEDIAHQGFKAFRWLIEKFKPVYHIHGHVHIYDEEEQPIHSIHADTKIINAFVYQQVQLQIGNHEYKVDEDVQPSMSLPVSSGSAAEDFRSARRTASVQNVLSSLTGRSDELLSFEDVSEELQLGEYRTQGLQKIPLDAIIGSVGRYEDFTRKFFPRQDSDEARWTGVRAKFGSVETMPPIEAYKVGEAYFVLDGNHRVSVARQNGEKYINGYVTEIETTVVLTPDDNFDDVIIKAQHAKFLTRTKLDELRPDVDFTVTNPGQFRVLSDHIAAHHYVVEMKNGESIPYEEAVMDWVDTQYLPTLHIIRQQGLLRDFPGRTPTDLYLWIIQRQGELAKEHGWVATPNRVAENLAVEYGERTARWWSRVRDSVLQKIRPATFDPGPVPGEWRRIHAIPRKDGHMFCSILVGVSGKPQSWTAMQLAMDIARREEGVVHGGYVIETGKTMNANRFLELSEMFYDQCPVRDVIGEFLVESGPVPQTLTSLARLNDLMILGIEYPPADNPIARFRSGIRGVLQMAPRPVLILRQSSPMQHALLAYDDSPKAREAMFLSAYLVNSWGIELSVVSAATSLDKRPEALDRAQAYLESRGIEAKYYFNKGNPGATLVAMAKQLKTDFIVMGGYGKRPVMEILRGSTVDYVLREYEFPILVCR